MTIFDQTLHPLPLALLRNLDAHGVKYASFTGSISNGVEQQIVAAVTGKRIRVLAGTIAHDGAGSLLAEWRSGTGGPSTLLGPMFVVSTVPHWSLNECSFGHFHTVAGEALILKNTGALARTVHLFITYTEVG